MSGHSHFATIKRQKEAKDSAKGKIFSRHGKAIAIAIKAGGSPNPEMNARLRFAIDQAKADNMPKQNIDRILARAEEAGNIDEIMYEGFGPGGTMVLVEAATDNRNRTAQELKNVFDKSGGNMGGPGSVSFNFDPQGLIVLQKEANVEEQMLRAIDLGADDIEETDDSLEMYMTPDKLGEMRKVLEENNFVITRFELTRRPKTYQVIEDAHIAQKVLNFLDNLESHDDVQKVHTNVEIPEHVMSQIGN
jgi:YebC/PmpR family DNA-binding regulatory protein